MVHLTRQRSFFPVVFAALTLAAVCGFGTQSSATPSYNAIASGPLRGDNSAVGSGNVTQTSDAVRVAPDATGAGPFETTSAEYRFPAAVDPEILDATPPRAVELWARVYRPADLSAGPYPVLTFLHGNHATCGTGSNPRFDDRSDYTLTGTCPDGYVVVPNHEGYGYLAERLASWGYVVVSINANRGINAGAGIPGDPGLNLVRGRLVLRHLQRLSEWNAGGGTPESLGVDLTGKLDFNYVGLMGHSRGGEGVRAAYNLYRDAGSPWPTSIPNPVTFQGIFEIAPVDGQTNRVLNADGITWSVLLPMCDGDVSNLQGVQPFDRMLRIFSESPATQKSTYTVWGANHNFYNTEWQVSDSGGCFYHEPLFPFVNGSLAQQQTGLVSVMAFFRGNVGAAARPRFNRNFNPLFGLPEAITSVTRVDRGFTDSPNPDVTTVFEDFDQPTGTNSYGFPNDASGITITHVNRIAAGTAPGIRHDISQRAALIAWTAPGDNTYFQTNWRAAGEGENISDYRTLDMRVARRFINPRLNPDPNIPTNFSIQLVQADGTLSRPVQLHDYTDLRGPVGGAFAGNLSPILQTVRIPLRDFARADLEKARGIRLTFNDTPTGAIFVANVRLSTVGRRIQRDFFASRPGVQGSAAAASSAAGAGNLGAMNAMVRSEGNIIRGIRRVASATARSNNTDVEIEVYSPEAFPVRNELPVLRVGDNEFVLSRYAGGDLHTLVFTLTGEEFAQITTGEEVTVQYGRGESTTRWLFGPLNKN